MTLYITRALPNPAGKDRPPLGGPSNTQLNGEWVEFKNVSAASYDLNGVRLMHYTFNWKCEQTGEDEAMSFSGGLDPGYSVRIHTGSGQAYWEGSVRHLFAGRGNYAWNNGCGDTTVLREPAGSVVDWAHYASNPAEGDELQRVSGTNILQ